MWAAVHENGDFGICGSNNWETVADRWIHAARGLTSTELSFHPCNILRDNRRGRLQGKQKCGLQYVKTEIFCTCGSSSKLVIVNLYSAFM